MGREAYLNLLSLGRQCFEPQSSSNRPENTAHQGEHAQQTRQPDQNQQGEQPAQSEQQQQQQGEPILASSSQSPPQEASPRSSQLPLDSQRAFRKAQNDVLTIVGIHLHRPGKDGSQYDPAQSRRENDIGLILGTLDLVTLYFLTWPLISIRNEIQTFRVLENVGYMNILGTAFTQRHFLEWFAGMPSHIVFQIANIFRDYGQTVLFRWLREKAIFRDKATGKPRKRLLVNCYKILSMSLDLLFFPIYRHSVLQSLHLMPAIPFFPSFSAFSPIPTGLLSMTFSEMLRFALSPSTYLESPFFWYLIQQKLAFRVHVKCLNIFSRLLPRPDKFEEVKASGGYVEGYGEIMASEEETEETWRRETAAQLNNDVNPSSSSVTQTFTATVQLEPYADGDSAPSRARRQTNASDISGPLNDEDVNEVSGHISEIEVQVTASTAREYAHGDGTQQDGQDPSVAQGQGRHYRNTQLASHPTDVIASHAADAVATSLTIGLESLVMRTTALSYLRGSTSGTIPRTNMILLLAQRGASSRAMVPTRSLGLYGVYRPMETGRNWGATGRALALEWGVTWGLFEAAYCITTLIAVKWFGYK